MDLLSNEQREEITLTGKTHLGPLTIEVGGVPPSLRIMDECGLLCFSMNLVQNWKWRDVETGVILGAAAAQESAYWRLRHMVLLNRRIGRSQKN